MSFLYIALTVTTGYPLISGIIGVAAGADRYEGLMYFCTSRFGLFKNEHSQLLGSLTVVCCYHCSTK